MTFIRQGKGEKETTSLDEEGDKLLLASSAVSRCVQTRATTVKPSSLLKIEDTSLNTEREATPAPTRGETTPVPVTVETPSRVASQSSLVETYSRNTTPAGEFASRSRTFRGQFYDPGEFTHVFLKVL